MDNRTHLKSSIVPSLLVALACMVMAASPTLAQRIRDGGSFFSEQAIADATAKLDAIQASRGASVVIETFNDPPPEIRDRVARADPQTQEQAFSRYVRQRGPALHADVYVFLNRNPKQLRLNVDDRATAAGFTPAQRDEVSRAMRDSFSRNEWDQGLAAGVGRIDSLIAQPLAAHRAVAAPAPQQRSAQQTPERNTQPRAPEVSTRAAPIGMCFVIGVIAIVVMVVVSIVRGIGRARRQTYGGGYGPPRYDPQTGQPIGGGGYGYGGGYGQPMGGGGFGRGLFGGVLGGLLGGYMADRAFGNHHSTSPSDDSSGVSSSNDNAFRGGGDSGGGFDNGSSDFGGGDAGSGDFGGGGDSGGSF